MNDQSVYRKDVASHFFLHAGLLLCIFYPFKGLLSFALYLLFGVEGFASYVNPGIAFSVVVFVFLSFNANGKWSYYNKLDLQLFSLGALLVVYSLQRRNFEYAYVIIFVLIMPVCLAPFAYAADTLFRRAVTVFFFLTALYIAAENIVLHSHIYGITDRIVFSSEDLARYYSLLVGGRNIETMAASGNVIDFREGGLVTTLSSVAGRIRTSGFIANPFQMATLIGMSTTFFYIWYRRSASAIFIVPLVLSLFGLANSLSTTAVMAFGLTAIFYELFYNTGVRKWFILIMLMLGFVVSTLYIGPVFYLLGRLMDSWDQYVSRFGFSFSSWQDYGIILVGKQGWLPGWNNMYNENDIVNVITSFGVVLAFFIFRRLIRPAFSARTIGNDELIVYAMVVLNAFFNMMHRESTFTPNVFMLIVLLNVKSYRMIREYYRSGI